MIRIQFVCLGNICRSPLAEGVFRHLVRQRGLENDYEIASAGTGAWHVGQAPDTRMQRTASSHGVDISRQRADQFQTRDLNRFDHIFAMDQANLDDILAMVEPHDDAAKEKVVLFRASDPKPDDFQVPDPYYGGERGFETVFGIVSRTCESILDELASEAKD